MSAEPSESPKNKKSDLITQFNDEYAKSLIDAQVSAEHTGTEGWAKLYVNERAQEQQLTRQLVKDLEASAQELQIIGPTENGEKGIGEIKKRITDLRERREAFDRNTVAPVKEPVEQCQRVIERFRSSARAQEMDAPLHNIGIEHLMK